MASGDVFVDTSGLYALVDRRDANHAAARAVVVRLLKAGRRFVLTGDIVAEIVRLSNAHEGSFVGSRALGLLDDGVGIRNDWMGQGRFDSAATLIRLHADRNYSVKDFSSFVVMYERGVTDALTTPHRFQQAGFTALCRRQVGESGSVAFNRSRLSAPARCPRASP
jgi:hypothetical protein